MSLLVQYTASVDTDFRKRIAVALATAAVAISSEPHGGANQPTDAQHTTRQQWAFGVLADPYAAAGRYAVAIMTNTTLAGQASTPSAIPDSDLLFTVNSLVNALAGA